MLCDTSITFVLAPDTLYCHVNPEKLKQFGLLEHTELIMWENWSVGKAVTFSEQGSGKLTNEYIIIKANMKLFFWMIILTLLLYIKYIST